MARHAGDLCLALNLLEGPEPQTGVAWRLERPLEVRHDPAEFRIALVLDDPEFPVDSAVEKALREAADSLRRAGAKVVEARPKIPSRTLYETYLTLLRGATPDRQSDLEFGESLREASPAGGWGP